MANDFKIKNGLQLGGALTENVGTISGNADLDLSTGNVFSYTPTADATFAFSNAGETEHSFVLGVTGANVAAGYDLANASYDSVSFSVAGQETNPFGIFFKSDGLKMYVAGDSSDSVNEYNLSTAWDVSSAIFSQSYSVSAQDGTPRSAFFKPDGLKMYVIGLLGDDINEYSLSVAWDISTASYTQNFSVASQDSNPSAIFFKEDGAKMYILGRTGYFVYEYDISVPWDVSSASYTQSFDVSSQETGPNALFFTPDGAKMYVAGNIGDSVNEYNLSTAWDVSTASYVQNFSVAAQSPFPWGLFFKPDGSKMYVLDLTNATIYQYSTVAATTAPATFTYPASVAWPSGTAPDAPAVGETDILEFSTTDGGTTWYGVRSGDALA